MFGSGDGRVPAAVGALLAALVTALAARAPDVVRLEAGHVTGGFLGAGWGTSDRTEVDHEVGALDPSVTGLAHFRFRTARPRAEIDLPVRPRGAEVHLAVRAMARVRTEVAFHGGGAAAEVVVPRGRWRTHAVTLRPPDPRQAFPIQITLRPLPIVHVPDEHVKDPKLWVAEITVSSPGGLAFSPRARLLFAAVPAAVFLAGLLLGAGARASLAAALLAAVAALALARTAPLPLILAVPRLLLPALALAVLCAALLRRRPEVRAQAAAALGALVGCGMLWHGALPFVPGYDPYDVEVHVRRARDLGLVTFDYGSLLLYGSHLPTPTQTFGTATAALGDRILVPYPPLSYAAFYGLHRLGLDLHWSMAALDAALAMAIVPLLWLLAARAWNEGSAWIAVLLYTLDLPVWHHLARGHFPATFGSALGAAALLHLARHADRLTGRREMALAASLVGLAILGYASLIVLLALFGATLLAVLVTDASGLTRAAKRGLLTSLVLGGLLAGILFYLHYLPGLLHGAGILQAEADPFPARTYFIFHNESRQSMRVWAAGFALPLLATAAAAPFALSRARPEVRPVLLAWLLSWPVIMLAKEPFLFPRPMRWAKEEQFIAPAVALTIAGAAWSLPRPWMRWLAAAAALLGALWIQAHDFRAHVLGTL